MMEKCEWRYDGLDDFYETSCGDLFSVMEGTPSDNGFKFCPYCGKGLEEVDG